MTYRCLDLFCGAGGATKGLQMAGFHVTGVDIKPQPRYVGDAFHQADAMTFPLEGYDLIWASPPCQGYSRTRHLPWLKGKKHPLLIDPVRAMLKASGALYVIENVMDAPLSGPALRGGAFGLRHKRERRFECSFFVLVPPVSEREPGVPGRMFGGRLRTQHRGLRMALRGDDARLGLDVPWMSGQEATQAIPPAYSHHIGTYAIMALEHRKAEEGRPK